MRSTVPLWRLFYFLLRKHKKENNQISDFFPLRCFLSGFFAFVCLFVIYAFAWLCFYAFSKFLCFLVLFVPYFLFVWFVRVKSFRKKENCLSNFIYITTLKYCLFSSMLIDFDFLIFPSYKEISGNSL